MTTAPIPEQWKPLGRTYNTRYFLAADDVMIVLPDQGSLADEDLAAVRAWVERGGVLLRLAGPKLAANPDSLMSATERKP